jgi:membrane protease YdiL (CAAX protease family)
MSTTLTARSQELPLAHAGLALGLLACGLLAGAYVAPALLSWPFYLLGPLIAYALVVVAVAPLRRSLNWMRLGRLDRGAWTAGGMIVVVSSAALVIWHGVAQPDVSLIIKELPRVEFPTLLAIGALFSCVNALLEEVLFRGLLFDALRSSYGAGVALFLQAAAFGAFHFCGFPSGAAGVILATIYGFMQGGLCVYTGGLAACWVAHVFADATIFALVLRHVA